MIALFLKGQIISLYKKALREIFIDSKLVDGKEKKSAAFKIPNSSSTRNPFISANFLLNPSHGRAPRKQFRSNQRKITILNHPRGWCTAPRGRKVYNVISRLDWKINFLLGISLASTELRAHETQMAATRDKFAPARRP